MSSGNTSRPRRGRATRRTNVVDDSEPLVGRDADLVALAELFERGARLVSLVAAGGMGKTRVARRFASEAADSFSEHGGAGAWFCDLTEAKSSADVCAVVASTLRTPLPKKSSDEEIVNLLGRAIARRGRTLFVLDNCEHIVELVAPTVQEWLDRAPDARFLTTTRIALGLVSEHRRLLEPLSTPASVDLFVRRARRVRPDLAPSPDDREVIADVVGRLEGMPLAIELAAARMAVLSPVQIRDRLSAPLDLLVARRDGKHASMRRTIEDSVGMLDLPDRRLFAGLAVFAGGFSLEAAEAVLGGVADMPEVLAGLERLAAASLVRTAPASSGLVRFFLYETIRELALEQFAELPTRDVVRARHAAYFALRARRLRSGAAVADDAILAALAVDLDNFHAAQMSPVVEPADALAIVLALVPLLVPRGAMRLLLGLLDGAITKNRSSATSLEDLAEAVVVRGHVLRELGDLERARAELEEGGDLARRANAPLVETLAEARLAELVEVTGATRTASAHLVRGLGTAACCIAGRDARSARSGAAGASRSRAPSRSRPRRCRDGDRARGDALPERG